MPMIIPHDPILDALFTPCRVMPAAVTLGLVRVEQNFGYHGANGAGGGGAITNNKNGIMGFEPARVYNIPPPVEAYTTSLQVPMAPLRQPSGGRFGVGIYPPGSSNTQSAHEQSPTGLNTTYLNTTAQNSSNNFPGNFSAAAVTTAAAAAATTTTIVPLTGADSHSSLEYDDERHDFLRRQEVALYVGPEYLASASAFPGNGRLAAGTSAVTPAERAALVDWVSGLHATAPAASGGGGEPLSLDTLFLAVNLMDRFLSTAEGARTVQYSDGRGSGAGPRPALKLAGAGCLALSSKYHDTQAVSLWGVAAASLSTSRAAESLHVGGGAGGGGGGGGFFGVLGASGGGLGLGDGSSNGNGDIDVSAARKELAAMEMRVASALTFRLTVPTALTFLGVYLRRAGALGYLQAGAPSSERVREEAQQILLCVMRDASSLEHPPSALAASALYWASCVTSPAAAPPASFAFSAVTGYELEQLCRCLRDMEGVRTGGGGVRHGSGSLSSPSGVGGGGGDFWAGAAFPEHAGKSLFGAGGGHPAIAAL